MDLDGQEMGSTQGILHPGIEMLFTGGTFTDGNLAIIAIIYCLTSVRINDLFSLTSVRINDCPVNVPPVNNISMPSSIDCLAVMSFKLFYLHQ